MKNLIIILLYVLTINLVKSQPKDLLNNEVKQLFQEINTARSNPTNYAIFNNIESERLDTLITKPNLIISYKLCQKAYSYSEYLAKAKYNEASIKCNHSTLNYNESIAFNEDLSKICKQLILDKNSLIKGHRFHLLGVNNKDTKIGIGISYIVQLDWYVVVIMTE